MSAVTVLVAGGDERQLIALAPLMEHWQTTVQLQREVPSEGEVAAAAASADAVLVIGPRNRSPRTVLAGPGVIVDGRWVPTAWLPAVSVAALRRFALAAAAVHRRTAGAPTLGLLAQRQPRYERLTSRILRLADAAGVQSLRWTAYDLSRADLVDRLHQGPALAVYVGHGRPIGWVGYAGLRAHHVAPAATAEPVGAIVSLTCKTASRRRTGLSFAEALPLGGIAAATVGAVGPTEHTANARWAVRVAAALPHAHTIGELLAAVAPHDPQADRYRLLGDPTAPLRDANFQQEVA